MKKKHFYQCCIILIIIHFFIVVIYGNQKQGFHEDEYYTYWSSTGKVALEPRSAIDVRTGYEIQRQFMVRTGEKFRFAEVIQNQEEDVHPPLYYLALNVVMSLLPEHFYKWFGLGVNMLCSCITLWGILFLFYSLGDKKIYAYAALTAGLVYAIAPSTISSVMFVRMYAMSAMWTVLYAYLMAHVVQSEKCSRKCFTIYTLAGALLCFFASLTHYFCLILPFFLTLAYCIRTLIRKKGIVRMLLYGLSMCAGIGVAIYLYPASLDHIFHGYRGEGAISGLINDSFRESCSKFLPILNHNVFADMMWLVLLVSLAALVFLLFQKERDQAAADYMGIMYLSCIAAFCFLMKTSLFLGASSCRYFYPVLALFLPLQTYLLCRTVAELTQGKNSRRFVCAIVVLAVCVPFLAGHAKGNVLFLFPEDAEKKEVAYTYGTEYPLVIVYSKKMSYRSWYMADQVWPFDYVIYCDYKHLSDISANPVITMAEGFLVYMDAPEETLDAFISANSHVSDYTLLRKDDFFYVYLLE